MTQVLVPMTELDAVNAMLSGIGEAPILTLSEATADTRIALSLLHDVCKELQLGGFHWNTEPNMKLLTDEFGEIRLHPHVLRVSFMEHDADKLTVRGDRVYDRSRHSFLFPLGTAIVATLTVLLLFAEMPEAARHYATLRALRIYQERVLGSSTLSRFQRDDEEAAKAALLADERKRKTPNMLAGVQHGLGTWRVEHALQRRTW